MDEVCVCLEHGQYSIIPLGLFYTLFNISLKDNYSNASKLAFHNNTHIVQQENRSVLGVKLILKVCS